MSEKQFGEFNQKRFITSVELDNSCGIEDLLKNKKYKGFREQDYHKLTEIRDELNELYYENEQLKSENIELKVRLDICKKPLFSKRQLHQENQQLKQQLHECRIYNGKLYQNGVKKDRPIVNDLIKQQKENTRIKQIIREAYENERTMIGKNVLAQLLEEIK